MTESLAVISQLVETMFQQSTVVPALKSGGAKTRPLHWHPSYPFDVVAAGYLTPDTRNFSGILQIAILSPAFAPKTNEVGRERNVFRCFGPMLLWPVIEAALPLRRLNGHHLQKSLAAATTGDIDQVLSIGRKR